MRRTAFVHSGSFFHLAALRDPAVVAFDIVDAYAPELERVDFESFDSIFLAARLHPSAIERVAPFVLAALDRPGVKVYVDGENRVGDWLPGTSEIARGTNFWAWRVGEDVGRRSWNQDHPFWGFLSDRAVHWHYHGVLDHPACAVPLVGLEPVDGYSQSRDPWGVEYRAVPDHPNTLMYYDAGTFSGEVVVSTMDSAYHHGSGFMPGASQLFYRMLRWLRSDGPLLENEPKA